MATLYITEQNAIVRKTGDRLVVEKDRTTLLDVPCLKLEAVLLYGNVQVTTQALAELLDHGIELALLSRAGKLRGQLTPPKAKNVPLRMRQYELSRSEERCLPLARELVCCKIANSVAVARRFRANHPEAIAAEAVADLERHLDGAAGAASLDSLRGFEGAAAAAYFPLLAAMVPEVYGFDGRNRRPPRDPVNALLSLGYVLVGNEIQALLNAIGFDPYLGIFHQLDYGRPSLALDLLEELRAPLVDRWTTNLLNLGVLAPADFTGTAERGVFLTPPALKRYFAAYEKEMTTPMAFGGQTLGFRQIFRRQAERLARHLLEGEPYAGFRYPC